jgi:ATP synthase subunit 6
MFVLLNGLVVSLFLLSFVTYSFFSYASRSSSLKTLVLDTLVSAVSSNVAKFILLSLFFSFLLINLIGNVPLNSIPTMYYRFTFSMSLLFWVPLMICVSLTQLKEFLAHMLPFGSPVGLMLFLPLVEIFSQLIRPLTLIIRLRTNLSSGHIMMYMFSYFTLLSSVLSPFIYVVLYLLFFLELAISMLQAYIFVSLLSLYINETV